MVDCIAEKNSRDKWIIGFIVNFLLAVLGGMILGLLPELAFGTLFNNSRLEPFFPAEAVCALLLGFFVSPKISNGRAASWIWVIGTLWLIYGIHETMSSWNADWATEKTAWGYANASLFGPTAKCSSSECIGELFYTWPCVGSVTYSVGALISRLRRWLKSASFRN